MRTESEKEWLLDAVDAVSTCFIVLSPTYEILAVNHSVENLAQVIL